MTLKKLFLAAMASVLVSTGMQAQVENFEIFRHVGGNLNVGTEGIGFDVATPVTDYLEVSAGMSFMPGFKVDCDVNVKPIRITDVTTIPMESVNIEGKFARTTANFKVSCYPFGTQNALFVAAGFSFGGKKIAKLKGHSEDVKNFMADPQYPADVKNQVYAEIDKYDVRFNENGDLLGDVRVNGFRPYLGLGYGRMVPKGRVGFRVELGCQFMGHMKVYQDDQELNIDDQRQGQGHRRPVQTHRQVDGLSRLQTCRHGPLLVKTLYGIEKAGGGTRKGFTTRF